MPNTPNFDEEYRELMIGARDAIEKLLDESAHDSWLGLRAGLREIHDAFAAEERMERLEELSREFRERSEAIKRGTATAADEREGSARGGARLEGHADRSTREPAASRPRRRAPDGQRAGTSTKRRAGLCRQVAVRRV